MFGLANPDRFLRFTRPLAPAAWALAGVLLALGAWLAFTAPEDFRQGDTVRIMFVHVPAHEWTGALSDTTGIEAWIAGLDAAAAER